MNKKGFTLVELIVSIGILCLVALLFAGMFSGAGGILSAAMANTRDTQSAALALEGGQALPDGRVSLTPYFPSGLNPSALVFTFQVETKEGGTQEVSVEVPGSYYSGVTQDSENLLVAFLPTIQLDDKGGEK